MGQRAQANAGIRFPGRGIGDSQPSEVFIVEHVSGTAANEVVRVKGNGREKIYAGVTKIYAYAGNGADMIVIAAGVLVDVHLDGGAGTDTLLYYGSGNAVICGEVCPVEGGSPGTPATVDDDDDPATPAVAELPDDYIEVGPVDNPDTRVIELRGNDGNDFIVYFGTGAASLYGGIGDDSLIGGPQADHLDGEGGNDEITGGGGLDTIIGGTGDDLIKLGLPTAANFPLIQAGENTDGTVDKDILIVVATNGDDDLEISDPAGTLEDLQIALNGGSGATLRANDLEELVLDLGPGADKVRVKSLHDSTRGHGLDQRGQDRHLRRHPARRRSRVGRRRPAGRGPDPQHRRRRRHRRDHARGPRRHGRHVPALRRRQRRARGQRDPGRARRRRRLLPLQRQARG